MPRRNANGHPLEIEVRVAARRADIVRCQYLIADIYNRHYGIVFSTDMVDLNSKIEPYPHRYAMGTIDGQLVAAAGLYIEDTYVEHYGKVTDADLRAVLDAGQVASASQPFSKREYTKLVVRSGWEGMGIGRLFFALTHSRDFVNLDDAPHPLLVCCAKLSVFRNLYDICRIRTRRVAPFPEYRVHEHYSSATDPMESRLVVPSLDIHPRWYTLSLPARVPVESLRDWKP